MKRIIFTILTVFALAVQSAKAMSYERAASEARFLTDKMAYELNLDEFQYQRAYEINFNYFYNLNDASDFYGSYWRTRNNTLGIILSALQFRKFCRLDYFYRPVNIYRNTWNFPIYSRYPRNRFFRPAPSRPPRPPRPRRDFHFESTGRPHPPRTNFNIPRDTRPDRSFNNSPNRNDRKNFNSENRRNNIRPSTRGNNRRDENKFQIKRVRENNFSERKWRR